MEYENTPPLSQLSGFEIDLDVRTPRVKKANHVDVNKSKEEHNNSIHSVKEILMEYEQTPPLSDISGFDIDVTPCREDANYCSDHLSELDFNATPSPILGAAREQYLIDLGYKLPSPLRPCQERIEYEAKIKKMTKKHLGNMVSKYGLKSTMGKTEMITQLLMIWDELNLNEDDKKNYYR
eukprot:UN29499